MNSLEVAGEMGVSGSAPAEGGDHPRLFVTLGRGPYPFPRLLRWVGAWAAGRSLWRVEVQHGATPAPRFGHAFAYGNQEDTSRLLRTAAVVISDAGPATIDQARALGHVPVVVARDPALGEEVDDHQIVLSRTLGAAGLVWLAESEVGLGRAIAAALAAAATPVDGVPPRRVVDELRKETVELAEATPAHILARSPSLLRDLAAEIGDLSPKVLELAESGQAIAFKGWAESPPAQSQVQGESTTVAREQVVREPDDSGGTSGRSVATHEAAVERLE